MSDEDPEPVRIGRKKYLQLLRQMHREAQVARIEIPLPDAVRRLIESALELRSRKGIFKGSYTTQERAQIEKAMMLATEHGQLRALARLRLQKKRYEHTLIIPITKRGLTHCCPICGRRHYERAEVKKDSPANFEREIKWLVVRLRIMRNKLRAQKVRKQRALQREEMRRSWNAAAAPDRPASE